MRVRITWKGASDRGRTGWAEFIENTRYGGLYNVYLDSDPTLSTMYYADEFEVLDMPLECTGT
jgi:hypothetical protein